MWWDVDVKYWPFISKCGKAKKSLWKWPHFTKRIFRNTILVTLLSSEKGCRRPLRRMCGFSRTSSHIWGMRGYVAKGRLYSKLRKVFSWVRFSRELRALVVVYYRCFPPETSTAAMWFISSLSSTCFCSSLRKIWKTSK